jgi:hypothetical protein
VPEATMERRLSSGEQWLIEGCNRMTRLSELQGSFAPNKRPRRQAQYNPYFESSNSSKSRGIWQVFLIAGLSYLPRWPLQITLKEGANNQTGSCDELTQFPSWTQRVRPTLAVVSPANMYLCMRHLAEWLIRMSSPISGGNYLPPYYFDIQGNPRSSRFW